MRASIFLGAEKPASIPANYYKLSLRRTTLHINFLTAAVILYLPSSHVFLFSPLLLGDPEDPALVLFAMSMICMRQRPNSSRISPSICTSGCPFRSDSSAWARRHWHVASTTSGVMKLKGCLLAEKLNLVRRQIKY